MFTLQARRFSSSRALCTEGRPCVKLGPDSWGAAWGGEPGSATGAPVLNFMSAHFAEPICLLLEDVAWSAVAALLVQLSAVAV